MPRRLLLVRLIGLHYLRARADFITLELARIGRRARGSRHHIWLRCRSLAHLQCAALLRLASGAPPPSH